MTVESGTDTLLFNKPFIKDESTNAYTISLIGDPQVKPFSPYRYEEYSEASHGSSGYFGGSTLTISVLLRLMHHTIPLRLTLILLIEAWCVLNSSTFHQARTFVI